MRAHLPRPLRAVAFLLAVFATIMLLMPMSICAQRQLWGYAGQNDDVLDTFRFGYVWRSPLGSGVLERILAFDSTAIGTVTGSPLDGLMQCSNGLLYGTASGAAPGNRSIIFSIDPVTDSISVCAEFGTPLFPAYYGNAWQLVEGLPGVLFGFSTPFPTSLIFRYHTATGELAISHGLPNVNDVSGILPQGIIGPLYKASDNRLYGLHALGNTPFARISWLTPANDSYGLSTYAEAVDEQFGLGHYADFNEWNGALYSTTSAGGEFNGGIVYSYSLASGVFLKHHDFMPEERPRAGLVVASDGRWYGVRGTDTDAEIFAFDPTTNAVEAAQDLSVSTIDPDRGIPWYNLLAATNGKLYGTYQKGVFEYDPTFDTLVLRSPLQAFSAAASGIGLGTPARLIEVCRKPSYKPRPITSFAVCEGAHFFYDLRNVNATSVVWRRNGAVVAEQTSQLLEFAAITEADEGVWACTLTNECGVTEPPPITITVNVGAFATSVITGDTLLCGNDDSASLNGNYGGTWVAPLSTGQTGTTTATLSVMQPGIYYVQHQQSCGLSYSNMLRVLQLDSARAPNIQGGEVWLCANDSTQLEGNEPGPWGLQATGVWSTGDSTASTWAHGAGEYYIVVANACSSDTSDQRLVVHVYPEASAPLVTYTDGQGQPADNLLCQGDSVLLQLMPEVFEPFGLSTSHQWYLNGSFVNEQGGDGSLWAQVSAVYELRTTWCGATRVDSIVIEVAEGLPPPAVILPDQGQLVGCDQDTVWLASQLPDAIWSWVDADGLPQQDTAQIVQVDWGAGNNGFYVLVNYNGCGIGEMDYIQVLGTPAPGVFLALPEDAICLSAGSRPSAAVHPQAALTAALA